MSTSLVSDCLAPADGSGRCLAQMARQQGGVDLKVAASSATRASGGGGMSSGLDGREPYPSRLGSWILGVPTKNYVRQYW